MDEGITGNPRSSAVPCQKLRTEHTAGNWQRRRHFRFSGVFVILAQHDPVGLSASEKGWLKALNAGA
jgi:hypothetical protein